MAADTLSSVVDLLTVALDQTPEPRLQQARELVLAVLFGEAYSAPPEPVDYEDIPF